MRIKAVTLGFVLAGTALGSAALTLGRARGAAWIGQSLELQIPVQIDPGQADGALCAEADVFHGDSRQDSARVQVLVSPTGQPDTFNLKINSSALVDEPVVTVYLRAGCAQKFSRKYVLLADFPSEVTAPSGRAAAAIAPQVPLLVAADTAQGAAASGAKSADLATKENLKDAPKQSKPAAKVKATPKVVAKPAQTVSEPAPQQQSPAKATVKTVKPAASEKAADSAKPRLRLDPVETLSERVKSLESTTTGTAAQGDTMRESQRLQLLQRDMKVLLEQATKNEASLVAMRERLERAEADRVPVAAVYGLGALVILCLGALALLWNKRPRHANWNNAIGPRTTAVPSTQDAALQGQAPESVEHFDVNIEDVDKASYDALVAGQTAAPHAPTTSKWPEKRDVTKSQRSDFNADHLVDLRQQAEFLTRLGKVDEAIEVLAEEILHNPKESPLLFMDLLGIANNFNRDNEYRHFRETFIQLFNVSVPEQALDKDEGRSLEDYPALLDHINSQWESPHVLDVIEACILRDSESRETDPFDLAAFRELVNMHGVASEHHNLAKA